MVYYGYIRKLMPLEAWRLQGFTDEQFFKVQSVGMSDAQLYHQQAEKGIYRVITKKISRFADSGAGDPAGHIRCSFSGNSYYEA